jgi:hypothetical protein
MIKDIGEYFKHPQIIKEIFEEPMICLDCSTRYKYKHGIHDPCKKFSSKCPKCGSMNVITKKDEEYFENYMKPYLEARVKDEYNPNIHEKA